MRADPELDALFVQLEQAEDAAAAAPIELAIRERWADSGSPTVNILLERAAAAEREGDADLAGRFLDQASDLAPDYAEPWKRRANLAYSAEDYPGAIAAIQETLKREPRHFEAMAGLGLRLRRTGPAARRARSVPRRARRASPLRAGAAGRAPARTARRRTRRMIAP